jgi:hypothetical protein
MLTVTRKEGEKIILLATAQTIFEHIGESTNE